jgi:hypothetical protein
LENLLIMAGTLERKPSRRVAGQVQGEAADQIRAIARLRYWRLGHGGIVPRAALADSLALGYYRSPSQGFQLAASPKLDYEKDARLSVTAQRETD